jgi:hypothetical protein
MEDKSCSVSLGLAKRAELGRLRCCVWGKSTIGVFVVIKTIVASSAHRPSRPSGVLGSRQKTPWRRQLPRENGSVAGEPREQQLREFQRFAWIIMCRADLRPLQETDGAPFQKVFADINSLDPLV